MALSFIHVYVYSCVRVSHDVRSCEPLGATLKKAFPRGVSLKAFTFLSLAAVLHVKYHPSLRSVYSGSEFLMYNPYSMHV